MSRYEFLRNKRRFKKMAAYQPRQIIGRWATGYALDLHTLSSVAVGTDEFGHTRFETTRPEIGELLYRLKYHSDVGAVEEIAEAAFQFLGNWRPDVDCIVPVPPTRVRAMQPVFMLADAIAKKVDVPVVNCLTKSREIPELKDVSDFDERLRLLSGLYTVDASLVRGKSVLLFDDLYRSGATMNAATATLYDPGKAARVSVLTITKTRSNQ
jgi:competence protein ComFC